MPNRTLEQIEAELEDLKTVRLRLAVEGRDWDDEEWRHWRGRIHRAQWEAEALAFRIQDLKTGLYNCRIKGRDL